MISVIVPFFNIKIDYVRNLIFCFKKQTSQNFEVLFIDDNSNNDIDYESVILESNYKYIKIKNGKPNLGYARDFGVQYCSGEYIWFVDCDDSITIDAIGYLDSRTKNNIYDLVYFDYLKVKNNSDVGKTNRTFPRFNEYTYENSFYSAIIKRMLNKVRFDWRMCIKKEFLLINNIKHSSEINYFEDIYFTSLIFAKTKKALFSTKILYFYNRLNSKSILNTISDDQFCVESYNAFNLTCELLSKLNILDFKRRYILVPYVFILFQFRYKNMWERFKEFDKIYSFESFSDYFLKINDFKTWILFNIGFFIWFLIGFVPKVRKFSGK